MNKDNLEIISSTENMPFSIGDFIQDDREILGKIIGIEEIKGDKFLKAKFAEHIRYLPLSKVGQELTIIKKGEIHIPNGKTTEQFLQEKEFERRKKINQQTLQRYIKSYTFKAEDFGFIFDDKIKKELEKIIKEALEKDFVFRSDGRHPYAKSNYDISNELDKGIFKIGLNSMEGKFDGYVYSTADINRALEYPHKEDMPNEWDQQKFIYFIDPKIIYQNIISLDLKDLKNNEIRTLEIPPEFIKYAIQIDGQTNKILKIFHNTKN